MNTSSRYVINAPDVVSEDFSGQTVMLNLANGHYFSVAGIGGPIWNSLLAGHKPVTILDGIRANRPELLDQASAFLERLVELNLIRADGADGITPSEPIAKDWSGEGPEIQVYDDLAELISSDPIHDVDQQAGWPTLRREP
ncbi:MAG TPA: hypothetical protein VMA86_09935 [Acetobacteraceae bacterium]|nr:hypothetical protein [Acetobacteraceae bacterium]